MILYFESIFFSLFPLSLRYQSSRYIDCQCPQGYEGRNCEMKKIEYRNDETNDDSSCSRKYLEIQAQSGDLEKVRKYFRILLIMYLYVFPNKRDMFFCGNDLLIQIMTPVIFSMFVSFNCSDERKHKHSNYGTGQF